MVRVDRGDVAELLAERRHPLAHEGDGHRAVRHGPARTIIRVALELRHDALQAAVSLATRVPESRQGDHAWTVKHPASDLVARGSKLCEWYGVDGWEEVRKYWQSRDETLTAALFPWSRLPCPAHPASDGPSESRRAGGAVPNALPHADAG